MQTNKSKAMLIHQYCWGALFCAIIGCLISLHIFERVDPVAIENREEREDVMRLRELYFGEPAETRSGRIAQEMERAMLQVRISARNQAKRQAKQQQNKGAAKY